MENKTKPNSIIEVVGYVPVPVRAPYVPTLIVERAAAHLSARPYNPNGGPFRHELLRQIESFRFDCGLQAALRFL